MSKWPVSSLQGKLHIKHGYPFKSEYFSDDGHYVVLTPGNFHEAGGFKRQAGKEKYYLGDIPEDYLHSKGDLIVAMTEQSAGLLGSCAFVPEENTYLHNQRLGLISTDPKELNKSFVYYLFQTKSVREQIRLTSTGSKVKHTSPDRLYAVTAPLPKVDEQKKIAAVLSALDAKIDCNNRINAELEAMAKSLYDYWFVQFDFPDANGKPYKSSGGKMAYNATLKREIPLGWGVLKLSDLVDLIKGNISPTDVSKDTPYVGLEHIGRRKIALTGWASSDLATSDKTIFKKNDILFGKIRPYFHKVTVAPFDGITSTDTIILRPKRKNYSGLALETVFADDFIDAATQSSTGSKMPRADWNVLKNYTIPGPTTDLLDVFNAVYENAIKKIQLSGLENRKLAELRDWLLPLLMNGQVTVA